jgi:hypothetical protein
MDGNEGRLGERRRGAEWIAGLREERPGSYKGSNPIGSELAGFASEPATASKD